MLNKKKTFLTLAAVLALTATATTYAAAAPAYQQAAGGRAAVTNTWTGRGGAGINWQVTAPTVVASLTAEETASLQYVREEEKLAHDVYVFLYEQWGLPVFQNIAQSEQSHTDAVKTLLDRYGVADPAAGEAPGQFSDQSLQHSFPFAPSPRDWPGLWRVSGS
ncbi:MAG: DUF2202 domain-containing protein [Dehalococcoidales bacterium]|nr:DUF2202 domain-containing protein [Dehalococcoidales bacterium]